MLRPTQWRLGQPIARQPIKGRAVHATCDAGAAAAATAVIAITGVGFLNIGVARLLSAGGGIAAGHEAMSSPDVSRDLAQ